MQGLLLEIDKQRALALYHWPQQLSPQLKDQSYLFQQ